MSRKGKKPLVKRKSEKEARRSHDAEELALLETRISGVTPDNLKTFDDLPISKQTALGLKRSHFTTLTEIQKRSIPAALQGRDVLGAAKTGSGKTLAFLIPMLECLYRNRWTQYDGLGALIISPTRELAIQIFDVLRKIGREHSFSAGLVIGGKDVKVEQDRISRLNILVGTPGRILQHMDQAAGFDTGNIKLIILDEADRILDMGFRKTLDAIIEHLPKQRQTLLFSATQTKSVADLARLSLSPTKSEYISAHESADTSTPKNLQQYYVLTPLPEKLDTLFSFLKTHLKAKILVFVSSSKQVRFMFETFKTLHPGIPLMHIHGRQKQAARIDVTERFSESKYACLFCTDVVARGLDFPAVDWVIQVDAPEDADTYIHRVGRTARFDAAGRALLFLTPSEETEMLSRLESKKVPIEKITIKETKKRSIRSDLQALCFKNPEIKYLGQKAFVSYCKSIFIQKDREVFKFDELPTEEFAESLGLPGAPRIKFISARRANQLKNAVKKEDSSDESESDQEDKSRAKQEPAVRTKYDRMFERQNQNVLSAHYQNLINEEPAKLQSANDDEEDFMAVKRRDHALYDNEDDAGLEAKTDDTYFDPNAPVSKRQLKAALSKKSMLKYKPNSSKLVFDDEGKPHAIYEFQNEEDFHQQGAPEEQKAEFVLKESDKMQDEDVLDKQVAKSKRQEKRRRRKEREFAEQDEDDSGSDEQESQDDELRQQTQSKRARKWFEVDTESMAKQKRAKTQNVVEVAQPKTLEDLEALSMRLLSANH
ncbi:P-loop containing nucleoside triphosphate hydrolase protein [Limtongia smithiae]|uniref:P-loop containing nucleoside triphosphate hydrolase protein n=1 Tax=Limtongia smithiae TaxID=1125753 RepID=UPI0034CF1CB3